MSYVVIDIIALYLQYMNMTSHVCFNLFHYVSVLVFLKILYFISNAFFSLHKTELDNPFKTKHQIT